MLYKPDWEQVRERLVAWWNGEIIDRAVVQVTAKRRGALPLSVWDVLKPSQFVQGPAHIVGLFEQYCEQTYFGGEAFPNLWINLGPGIMAAYLGAEPQVRDGEGTTWFETPGEWDEIEDIAFDPENAWWQKTCELTAAAVEEGQGRFLIGLTDIGGNLDIAASLRGAQTLAMDLIDSPERVKELCAIIDRLWFQYYTALYEITKEKMEGTSAWMGIWAPGRWYPLQCDFSAMISPRMFEEFVLPYLEEECRWLDYPLYHWDGPGQIPHLDLLLEIGELRGIQWVPGAGAEPTGSPKWFPLYERILGAGKNLVIEVLPEDVGPLIAELGPRGILLQTACETVEEAERLIEQASRVG